MRTWQGGGIDPARVDFFYNDAGQRTQIDRFSDINGIDRIGRTEFGYDAQVRLDGVAKGDILLFHQ
jgi:hypothetical protein